MTRLEREACFCHADTLKDSTERPEDNFGIRDILFMDSDHVYKSQYSPIPIDHCIACHRFFLPNVIPRFCL